MTSNTNVSRLQLLLSCIGTVFTILVIVVGSYISLRVEAAANEARLDAIEKRIDKTDEKFDRILEAVSDVKVELGRMKGMNDYGNSSK